MRYVPRKIFIANVAVVLIACFLYVNFGRLITAKSADADPVSPTKTASDSLPTSSASKILDFLRSFKTVYTSYMAVIHDRPNVNETSGKADGMTEIKGPSTFDELSMVLDTSFYPESWLTSGAYEAVQSMITPDVAAFLRAAKNNEPYAGYLLLLPPSGAMAISGHHEGKKPNDRFSSYELIATPATYGDGACLSYFISSHQENIRYKDMGRAATVWSFYEKERPLASNGGWQTLPEPPAALPSTLSGTAIPVQWRGNRRQIELSVAEENALVKIVGIAAMQTELKRGRYKAAESPLKGKYAANLQVLLSVYGGENQGFDFTGATGDTPCSDGYFFFMPGVGEPLMSGDENDYAARFEIVATPADYPKSGKYTFYFNSNEKKFKLKDVGRQMNSWGDFTVLSPENKVVHWEEMVD